MHWVSLHSRQNVLVPRSFPKPTKTETWEQACSTEFCQTPSHLMVPHFCRLPLRKYRHYILLLLFPPWYPAICANWTCKAASARSCERPLHHSRNGRDKTYTSILLGRLSYITNHDRPLTPRIRSRTTGVEDGAEPLFEGDKSVQVVSSKIKWSMTSLWCYGSVVVMT